MASKFSFLELNYPELFTISELSEKLFYSNIIPEVVKDLFHAISESENRSSHNGNSSSQEALFGLKKCYQFARWFYETYENILLERDRYILPEKIKNKAITEWPSNDKWTDYALFVGLEL